MKPIVHIVDDDRSFRTAIGRLVEASGFRAAVYESGDDLLARVPAPEAGCILLDLNMPGISGPVLQRRLAEEAPLLPVVFLTGEGTIEASVRAIKAGAEDFLEKSAPSRSVIEAIDRALIEFERRRSERDRTDMLKKLVAGLTPREAQVFGMVVRGRRNKQIAFDLNTSERTIKAHRHSIMEKLGVNSLAEAVSIAERLGLLQRKPEADKAAQSN